MYVDSVSLLMSLSSVAILTARIRNYQEHLQKHHKVSEEELCIIFSLQAKQKGDLYMYYINV